MPYEATLMTPAQAVFEGEEHTLKVLPTVYPRAESPFPMTLCVQLPSISVPGSFEGMPTTWTPYFDFNTITTDTGEVVLEFYWPDKNNPIPEYVSVESAAQVAEAWFRNQFPGTPVSSDISAASTEA